mmetsp:Transcript_27724/g.38560  ORF Transcript_27724/g.38560 Transcript_27724/m.38560 type:complete len:379 (-) Transcript_27724:271-1407(-)|eukprot:CAMPEP_0184488194 /NCGR_PEP_ID=MMETSP0113_2-20130426/10585_1 /TAXON_ID=91329 /ORGANISM="Norrisiella sphaerica, Strain BC52" /LENGTH=378 /DNA_ID=CAMNT_0026870697 /DNA_START=72 /DNA_END=1208 /DNA_ORIENTATION=+
MLGQPPPSSNGRSRRTALQQQPVDTSVLTDEEYLELKERLEKFQDTLRRMAKHAGNKRCADCREHNPRYIDVTWGVYLCLLCSGAHQKTIGSTVVTVDTTEADEQWIETLEQRGNDKVNDDLEYKLETSDKRKMSWSITNRAKFVTRKYVNGEWMRKGAKIDLKDPSKVAALVEQESAESGKKKKKKGKKGKKSRKKKETQQTAPFEESAGQSSAPVPVEAQKSTSPGGISNLFDLLSTDDKQPQPQQQQQVQPTQPDAKNLMGDKSTHTDIMAMFENPTPQPQPGSYGMAPQGYGSSQYGGTANPFMGGAQTGNPFAQANGYGAQPGYGYGQQQPQYNQNQMWQMQQQNTAYQQQQRMQQQQQQKTQANGNDILNFF